MKIDSLIIGNNLWNIQDDIKFGHINYRIDDTVVLFYKRSDGYPKQLEIGDVGTIKKVELNHLIVEFEIPRNVNLTIYSPATKMLEIKKIKIAKKYVLCKRHIRELKIQSLLA